MMPPFSSDSTLPIVDHWPWHQRAAWVLGTLCELRRDSRTTFARLAVECSRNLDLADGSAAWLDVGGCWPQPVPESAIGRDLLVQMGPWKHRRKDGRAFRGTTWKWA